MLIIVHGGAGKITDYKERKEITIKACQLGYSILKKGGNAIDAVQKAVVELENSPLFNAGTGSVLSLEGKAEMDAAIMTDDLKAGAVAGIENVKNPILVARKVMEETDHILLVSKGAERFARVMGFPKYNPVTLERKEKWETELKKLSAKGGSASGGKEGKKIKSHQSGTKLKKFITEYGTVGACAMDKKGNIVAGTSTGGLFMHLPGRVGDTPMIGAGTYACKYGAVSCTGRGESIIRICLAKTVCDLMKTLDAQSAINKTFKIMNKENCSQVNLSQVNLSAGIIGVDKKGNSGYGFNTEQMLWAGIKDGKLFS